MYHLQKTFRTVTLLCKMSTAWCFILILIYVTVNGQSEKETSESSKWPRWEERTIDCTTTEGKELDQCTLIARNAKIPRDPTKYKCRREPMPVDSGSTLAQSSTRLACPIGCEPDAKLSVLVKSPQNNHLCQKYYTYGKYRDQKEGEWYLWLTEPCRANITTWCRFKDTPLFIPKLLNQ
uniref:Secreted protein n=1 Tax=Elaeophora elaphi TaxID=1147741 RepID=A0A0R3RZC7_9BILA